MKEARQAFAIRALVAGTAVGLIGNILFYNKLVGLSFPIFTLIVTGAVLFMSFWVGLRLHWRTLWPLLPLLFFAVMVAIRADVLVQSLNVMSVLALGGLVLYFLPSERHLDLTPFAEQVWGVIEAGLSVIPAGIENLLASWGWLRSARLQRLPHFTAAIRGLLIAVPILIVFGVLLGSADAVFGDYLDKFLKLFDLTGMDSAVEQATLTGGLAFLSVGAMAYVGLRHLKPHAAPESRPEELAASEGDAASADGDTTDTDDDLEDLKAKLKLKTVEKRKPGFKLSMIETSIVLGSVDLLFAAFVIIQFAYFFGGQTNVSVEGLTYAQYARRGFFELVAVSVMTLGLALWLDHVTVRQEKRENQIFRVLSVIVVGLTSVMLVSASQRMWLYEQAFGFTQLRVYTHVFMLWLGVLFVFFLLTVFRVRPNVFSLGILLCLIGYLGTINLLNVDAYIAEQNIARAADGAELDIQFLNILSSDAVPGVIALYTSSDPLTEAHKWAGNWLAGELLSLDSTHNGMGATLFSAHSGRDAAWGQLDAIRSSLPAYNPDLYPRYRYSGWDY